MPREQAIERIRKAVIEAVPEIMELGFGCELEFVGEDGDYIEQGHQMVYTDKDDGKTYLWWSGKYEEVKILGRPIRLADVLWYVGEEARKKSDKLNSTVPVVKYIEDQIKEVACNWNLLRDSLTEQSDETILFLNGLLEDSTKK